MSGQNGGGPHRPRSVFPGLFPALAFGLLLCCFRTGEAQSTGITVDYPLEGSIFPPDFAPPTFLWRDAAAASVSWSFEFTFADGQPSIRVQAPGGRMRLDPIDERCVSATNQPPRLTPQQAAAHAFKPDAAVWEAVKRRSAGATATVRIAGYRQGSSQPVSEGSVRIQT